MSKYKHKIPKDDLKRFGKEIAKKLVNSDYKAGRVKDPTKVDEKQQKKIKAFCKEYFDKALQKHQKHEADRAVRKAQKGSSKTRVASSTDATPGQSPAFGTTTTPIKIEVEDEDDDEEMNISDNEIETDHEAPEDTSPAQSATDGSLKRKRLTAETTELKHDEDSDLLQSPVKKPNLDSGATSPMAPPPPPPPPPAPPADSPPDPSSPTRNHEEGTDDTHTDIHADTNFKGKSMADVLAQAQAEEDGDDEDKDVDMLGEGGIIKKEDGSTRFEVGALDQGADVKMENPLVEGQAVVERIKEKETREYKEEDEVEWA